MKTTLGQNLLPAALLAPPVAGAGETNKWTFDVSLYGLAAGMSGNIGLGRVNADVDVGFDKVWNDLEMALFVDIGIDSEMPVIEPPCLQNPQHLQARTKA